MPIPEPLDHLVFGVTDLQAGVHAFARGSAVRPAPGGRHVGRGTANYLVGLGAGAYLEIIGPDPDQGRRPASLPFGLEGLTGSKLITWAIRVGDIEAAIVAARERGYDPGEATAMSRRTGDGGLLEWQLTPASVDGGVVPFLIDWGTSAHPTATTLPTVELLSLTAHHPKPGRVRRQLAALDIDIAIYEAPTAHLRARLRTPAGDIDID